MADVHVWELNGYGKAPFKCVGVFTLPSRGLLEHNPAAYNNVMRLAPSGFRLGTCHVCGMALTNNFLIRAACGTTFSVGCDCVLKCGSQGLINEVTAIQRKVAREKRAQKRMERTAQLLQEQRDRNGGLTDYEVREKEYALARQQKADAAKVKGELIGAVLGPIVTALKASSGAFVADMVSIIARGDLPSPNAMAICCTIYSKFYAQQETKKTRGPAFDEAKAKGIEVAHELFHQAEQMLANA